MTVHDLESRRRRRAGGLSEARGNAARAAEESRSWGSRFDPAELIAAARTRTRTRTVGPRFRTTGDRDVHRRRGQHTHPHNSRHPDPALELPSAPAAASERPRRAARALAFVQQHWLSLGIVAVLLAASGALHAIGIGGWPRLEEDEGTYIFQAWAVRDLGALAPYTYWYDHPPVGWLLIAGWWSTVGDLFNIDDPVMVTRSFMVFLQLISAALVFAVARRVGMRRGFAALAVALFSFSPLALELQRIGFLDNIAVPFLLASFLLAMNRRQRLWHFAAAAALFAIAVLVKETFLLMLPGLALAIWRNADRSTRGFCLGVAGAVFALIGGSYVLYAVLKGELVPGADHVSLWEGIAFQLFDRRAGGSIFDATTENGATVSYWLDLDVILPAAALLALPFALFVKRLRPIGIALALPAAMLLRPGYVPHMYVIALLPLFGLVIAGACDWLWTRFEGDGAAATTRRYAGRALVVAAIAGLVVVAASPWSQKYDEMTGVDRNSPYAEAEAYAARNVPLDAKLLVEASTWLELVKQGRDPADVVWFYKLDHDPGVGIDFPNGWRDIDYLVVSQFARVTPQVPQTQAAIRGSRKIASFGTGNDEIEIRKVIHRTSNDTIAASAARRTADRSS